MPLPEPLEAYCQSLLVQLRTAQITSIDPEDILAIGQIFGKLSGQKPGISAIQRRHLLMLLLSLRYLLPQSEAVQGQPTQALLLLQLLATILLPPFSLEAASEIIDTANEWDAREYSQDQNIYSFPVCFYTVLNAIDACVTGSEVAGSPAEVHAGVALNLIARTFQRNGIANAQSEQLFWSIWLTIIIPNAWYEIIDYRL